jgi:hypothetical protein
MTITFGARTARNGSNSGTTVACTTPATGDKLYALFYYGGAASTLTWDHTGWSKVIGPVDGTNTGVELWSYSGAVSDFATHSPTASSTPTW